MKKTLVIAFWPLLWSVDLKAQEIPRFDYVNVETIDYSGVKDLFQVSLYTRKWMVDNGFVVITDNKRYWPEEAKQDSCRVITVKLQTHDHYRGKYHTSLFVVGCTRDTVFRSEGKSIGSTDAQGFQNAAGFALKDLKKALGSQQESIEKNRKTRD